MGKLPETGYGRGALAASVASILAFIVLIGPALEYGSAYIWLGVLFSLVACGITVGMFYSSRGR